MDKNIEKLIALASENPDLPILAMVDGERAAATIDAIPTADVEEVKHGQYEGKATYWELICSRCSECGYTVPIAEYCCWCGAKMDGGNDERRPDC